TKQFPPPGITPARHTLPPNDELRRQELGRQARKRGRQQESCELQTTRFPERFAGKFEGAGDSELYTTSVANFRQPIDVNTACCAEYRLHDVDEVLQTIELMADGAVRRRNEQQRRRIAAIPTSGGDHVVVDDRHISSKLRRMHEVTVDLDHHLLLRGEQPFLFMIVLADTVLELEQFETERRHHITHFVAISDVDQNVDVRKGPKSCLGIKSLRKSCAFYDCSANFGFCKRLHNSLSVMRQHHLK